MSRRRTPARRAVVRWAWRMLRREWRQQAMVLTMLTVTVAASVGAAAAAYAVAPASTDAIFGTADHSVKLVASDPSALRADLAAVREWFGTIDVIGRWAVPVPGSSDPVEFREQAAGGAYSAPMLRLRDGRYPRENGEVAVTDGLARAFALRIGEPFSLGGTRRTVVGVAENPSDLRDEFALVAPSPANPLDSVTILVEASDDRVAAFRPPASSREIGSRARNEGALAAASVLGIATVVLLLVALVAAAGFIVVAQRRLRQLGMLAAIGATEKDLRLVTVANGAVIGIVGAVAGCIIGSAAWIAVAPQVETAAGFRIDRFDVPWWLIATAMVLAIVTATAAAWWPARKIARVPIVLALSGRPPPTKPVHRSAALAGLVIAIGVACLAGAGELADETAVHWTNVVLVLVGTAATVVGVLLLCPLVIRAPAVAAARFGVAVRLAVRDLARYGVRSAAALAAITLVLGIPAAIVVTAAGAEHGPGTGNLSDRQLLVRGSAFDGPFVPHPSDLERLQAQVDQLGAALDDAMVTSLDVALDSRVEAERDDGRLAVSLATRSGDGWRDLTLLYLATPALLEHHGLDRDAAGAGTEIFSAETGELRILGARVAPGAADGKSDDRPIANLRTIARGFSSLPASFITPDGLRRRGWDAVGSGRWLIETREPITDEQIGAARDLAAGADLTIEARDDQGGLATLRSGATVAGMLLALGVLAMTIGLIRGEAAGDLRILTAAGATSTTRRGVTAATAGGLALLGATLGTAGAYLVLMVGYIDSENLSRIPVLQLAAIVVGTPLAAAAGGWLLAGREPSVLARQPLQ